MQHPHPEYQTEPYRHVCSSSKIRGSTVLNSCWQALAQITDSFANGGRRLGFGSLSLSAGRIR